MPPAERRKGMAQHSRATGPRRWIGHLAMVGVVAIAGALLTAPTADARITKIQVDTNRSEKPTFGGYSWPGVGQYEKIVGRVFGELDPLDPKNAVIVDLELAPRNIRGMV